MADLGSGSILSFDGGPQSVDVSQHGLLFMVADGMGGAASGELASGMAGEVVYETLQNEWRAVDAPGVEQFAVALRDATIAANARIHGFARENPEHRGMGTTATIAGLFGDTLYVAQVGDSRAYLVRDGAAQQLTKDQSLMQRLIEAGELTPEQAEASERRNIILQALGPEAHVTIDLTHQQLRSGDTLILCSDGLSGLVRGEEFAQVAEQFDDVQTVCQQLIDRANERGGPDNITVVTVQFSGTALEGRRDGDSVGYLTYQLAGTLNQNVDEDVAPDHALTARFKSDPTPRLGTPAPSQAALNDEILRKHEAEQAAQRSSPGPVLGAPEQVVEERRRKIEPMYYLLAAAAAIAAVWLLVGLLPSS